MKKISKLIISLVIVGGLGLVAFYKSSLGPVNSKDTSEVLVEIKESSSAKSIGQVLKDKGLIKSKTVFLYELKKNQKASQLRAGSFKMNKSMDLYEITDELTKGGLKRPSEKFTIPEGYELVQVAQRLEEMGLVNGEEFLNLSRDKSNFEDEYEFLKDLEEGQSLEGYLFPSTYEVYSDAGPYEIITKMLDEFNKVYKEDIVDRLPEKRLGLNLNEIITLASIIEREAKVEKERPIMAGVFYNRLEEKMNLQSCATIQYILGERKTVLSIKETRTPSAYNTYINPGLPPGPIASPGRDAILAALEPEEVDYRFFRLTGDDGSHTFTRTYEEHQKADPRK